MKISVFNSYDLMSATIADRIIERLQPLKEPVFCAASGETPTGLYKALINRHNENRLNVSDWFFLGLDEWIGLDKYDHGSCRNMLDRDLFHALVVEENHICFFDGKTNDPASECSRVEEFINRRGGIDVAVLGLGMNGHIGMNEPGTSPYSLSHVTVLDTVTKEVGQKYFLKPQRLSEGMTLGICSLMKAKNIALIVNGQQKAVIVKKLVEGGISKEVPATWLRNHPDCTLYLDAGAASLLHPEYLV